MDWMECQSCRKLVKLNNTAICLGCQRGFVGIEQEDAWKPEEESCVEYMCCTCHSSWEDHLREIEEKHGKSVSTAVQSILKNNAEEIIEEIEENQKSIEKETEYADEITSSKSVSTRQETKDGR